MRTCSADAQGLSMETHCTKLLSGGGKETIRGLKLPVGGTAGKQIRD